MYLIDFVKRLARKSNIPVIIYLVLNIVIITGIMEFMFGTAYGMSFPLVLLLSIVLYAISISLALSPVGEWILRVRTGCKKIKRVEQIEFIEPIFREVYDRAKRLDPSISDNVQIFINGDKSPNAFATGRKTICITEGMLQKPVGQIKATLGHEFGHLAHKDTDLILVVQVGNMFINAFITMIQIGIIFFEWIGIIVSIFTGGREGLIGYFFTKLGTWLTMITVNALTRLWGFIGNVLVMKSSRGNEYEADHFSYELGYGNDLCALLESFGSEGAQGLFAALVSSHPDSSDRIAKLQEAGSSYRAQYGGAQTLPQNQQPILQPIMQPAMGLRNHYAPQGGQPQNQGGYPQGGQPQNRGGYPQGGQPQNRGGYPQGGQPQYRGGYPQGGQPQNRGGYPQGGQLQNRGGYPQGGQPQYRGGYPQGGQPQYRGGYPQGGQPQNRGGYPQGGQPQYRGGYPQGGQPQNHGGYPPQSMR